MAGARIFLSYKHGHGQSLALLRSLQAALVGAGYQAVADEGIRGGDRWSDELYKWLLECAGAVVLATPDARASEWCQREWNVLAARNAMGVKIVPITFGLSGGDLGPLSNCQALHADDPALEERVLAALGDATRPWQVSADDIMALHGAWIDWQYRQAPILGNEPFTLSQVYIDTECGHLTWEEIDPRPGHMLDPFDEKNGGRTDLLGKALALFSDPSFKDVVVVQGVAGCGKSAFTLRLAHELRSKGLEPLLLRFRDMRLTRHDRVDELLEDAIRVGPESEQPVLPVSSLLDEARLRTTTTFGEAMISKTVVILDGWDEVSLAGSAGYQAQLRTWLPRFREFFVQRQGSPVRVLVTGRPSLEVKESGFLLKRTPILTLRPMRPEQLRRFSERLCQAWKVDSTALTEMHERYENWFRGRPSGGHEMLGQPLLALLAIRTIGHHHGGRALTLLGSTTTLYKALIDQTVPHAGRAERSVEGTVHRGGPELRKLLQRVAALTSVFWSERISFEELDARLEGEGALAGWIDQATSDHPLYALVVNFWFKGGHKELGCEFMHKSFREYLYAEAIVDALLFLSEGHRGRLNPPDLPYWQDFAEGTVFFQASRALAQLLAPQWMTLEVRNHLFRLLEAAITEDRERWIWLRDLLADVYGWWADGVHLRRQSRRRRGSTEWIGPYVDEIAEWSMPFCATGSEEPMRTVTLDAHLGDALLQITAFVHESLNGRQLCPELAVEGDRRYQVSHNGDVWFYAGGANHWYSIATRLSAAILRPLGFDLSQSNLAGVVLCAQRMPRTLSGANLRAAHLANTDMSGCDLSSAFLEWSNLKGVDLTRSNLQDCYLMSANLSDAHLHGADLTAATLVKAKMKRADLARANLVRASLVGADLGLADLTGANLESADLANANLERAKLTQANLTNTNLTGANMRGAVASRSAFSKAIGANHDGVEFLP